LKTIYLSTNVVKNVSNIAMNGEIFEDKDLRAQLVNEAVSAYSAVTEIRKFLVDYQRSQVEIARANGFSGLVMEGRDITSVILPGADLKFFLDASAKERSRRRKNDEEADCVNERDKIDNQRTICRVGVQRIDTGLHDLPEVVEIISTEVDKLLKRQN
jgi:cytidylate kinase